MISSGSVYYSNRGNVSFYCGGKLTAGAKLQLVMTVGDEEVRSNVVEVQPSPDWGTPYAAFEVSALKSNAESVKWPLIIPMSILPWEMISTVM